MHFSQHDLDQMSEDTLDHLSQEDLLSFSQRLLVDLTEARELLKQQSNNSLAHWTHQIASSFKPA